MKKILNFGIGFLILSGVPAGVFSDDLPSQMPNALRGTYGIANTRHNMSQNTEEGNNGMSMSPFRNRYGEVCVYCHTPHAAENSGKAPLWNRTLPAASNYTTYTTLNSTTMTQVVNAPGGGSLPCLSCHDGTQAVDAILNMPGSGQYSATANPTTWVPLANGTVAQGYAKSVQHRGLSMTMSNAGVITTGSNTGCLSCHGPDTGFENVATDFTVFVIGTDLRNDHPVGVTFPATTGAGTDWQTPSGTKTFGSFTTKFFDENGNGRMDKGDIRIVDSGNGASVECSSCHDPHGVPGPGGVNYPTFLRKTNTASAVCLTCHAK